MKVFQSDKCEKELSSHHLGSVAKESVSKCFKVTSVKKCCPVIFLGAENTTFAEG